MIFKFLAEFIFNFLYFIILVSIKFLYYLSIGYNNFCYFVMVLNLHLSLKSVLIKVCIYIDLRWVKIRGYFMNIRYLGRIIGLSLASLLVYDYAGGGRPKSDAIYLPILQPRWIVFRFWQALLAYLMGLIFSVQGILLFKDHVDGGSGTMMRAPVPISSGRQKVSCRRHAVWAAIHVKSRSGRSCA